MAIAAALVFLGSLAVSRAQEAPPPGPEQTAQEAAPAPAAPADSATNGAATAAAAAPSSPAPAAAEAAGPLPRDPFWPVGWQPPDFGRAKEAEPEKEKSSLIKWTEAAKLLKVRGITRSGKRFFAVVSGMGVVEAGDVITVDLEGLTYRWTVAEITEKGLAPRKLDVFPTKPSR
jgi:hypothetical protein